MDNILFFFGNYGFRDYLFFLENLVIVGGYLAVSISLIFLHKIFPLATKFLSWGTRLAGTSFFAACAITTHIEMSYHILSQTPMLNAGGKEGSLPWHMIAGHGWQAVSIATFLALLGSDITRALESIKLRKELEKIAASLPSNES